MNISFSKLWILVVQKVGRIVNDPHFFNKSQIFHCLNLTAQRLIMHSGQEISVIFGMLMSLAVLPLSMFCYRFFGKRAEQNFAELVEDSNINFPQFFLKLLILPQFVLAFIVVFYLVQSLCKNVKF